MRSPLLLLALSACAAVGQSGREAAALDRELVGRVPGPPEKCVPSSSGSGLTIVDAQTLTYRSGGAVWVNRLRDACPGLRSHDTLIVETFGSSYCRNDRVRAISPSSTIPGPSCLLGDFVPYRLRR